MDDDMDIEAMLDAPLEKKKQEDSVSQHFKVPHCQAPGRRARIAKFAFSVVIKHC